MATSKPLQDSSTPLPTRMFRRPLNIPSDSAVPSSSPAFATPLQPVRSIPAKAPPAQPAFKAAAVLPVNLPPATLRPVAYRVFKRNNLVLQTPALVVLAAYIGKNCGTGWKDSGLADGLLEEIAKLWKKQNNGSIVNNEGGCLQNILKTLESSISGGRIVNSKGLSRQSSFAFGEGVDGLPSKPGLKPAESFGMSTLEIEDEDEDASKHPRDWLKVIDAYDQPRLTYDTKKRHFDRSKNKPSLFPGPKSKTELFRQRYHIVHQRVLRHEGFQQNPLTSLTSNSKDNSDITKITPISNLLGRSDTQHMLLGLLTVLPTGALALSDLTGSIPLNIQHAWPFPDTSASWFCPGMLILVTGIYVESGHGTSESSLGSMGGIGATIGGTFNVSVMAHPPCERRAATLGIKDESDVLAGAAFGFTDFLGVGSERGMGPRMRQLQTRILGPDAPHEGNSTIAIAADLALDQPSTLSAVRSLFAHYAALPASQTPLSIILMGNFVSQPALSGVPGSSSIEYKECFNNLASVISDFPTVLANTTLVMVPGDQDAWPSAFSAGSAAPVPRKQVPEIFTTRIRRAVAEANRENRRTQKGGKDGEVIWTSNPSRLTWFGCAGEMVLYRDDLTGRLRRSALRFSKASEENEDDPTSEKDTQMTGGDAPTGLQGANGPEAEIVDPDLVAARRLTKTILDQAHLSPFPLSTRPVHWDYANTLHLYPLPSSLVLADPDAPAFALNYMGCCVMNPGRLAGEKRGIKASWVEYDVMSKKGEVRAVS